MTDNDFDKFVKRYRTLRLTSLDFEFVLFWRPKLERFDLGDLLGAVEDLAADPRVSFPTNDLPLLIEHASTRRERRERANRKTIKWGKMPPSTEGWDREMMKIGAIDQKEFNRRQAARKGGAA